MGDIMTLPEIVTIGIYNSRLAAKTTAESRERKTAMFEVELPIEAGGVSFIDGKAQNITTDMLVCAKPGQMRHSKLPYSCYYVHMILSEGELYDTLSACPDFIQISDRDFYVELFKKLIKYHSADKTNGEIMLGSVLLELIYSITKDAKRNSLVSHTGSPSAVIKAIEYIKKNLAEDLSLGTVAAYVSLSPVHFHNTFKVAVGKTLHKFVEEQRLKAAVNLLVTSNMTLSEIAYTCGFSSQSYFSFAFKREMKTTPREYTKALNEMYEI